MDQAVIKAVQVQEPIIEARSIMILLLLQTAVLIHLQSGHGMQHLQHGSFIHKGDQIMAYFKCSSARAEVKPTKSFTVGLSLSVEKNSNNHAYVFLFLSALKTF